MPKKDKDIIKLALTRYDRCVEAESRNRQNALAAIRFKAGDQWPDKIKKERQEDGRPCLTLNRCKPFVRHVINDIRQTRPAIKVRGVDDKSDVKTAEVMNGMIRAIEQSSNAEIAYDWAAESAVTTGWGYFKISTQYEDDETFNQGLSIKRINNLFSVHLDPDSQEPDGSDSRYGFIEDSLDKETFEDKYPKARSEWEGDATGTHKNKWFTDAKVKVAEYWAIEETTEELSLMHDGQVFPGNIQGAKQVREVTKKQVIQYIMTSAEILETNPWAGKYVPIIPVLGEEQNIEGERQLNGMIFDLMDPQRQYNYWRTASTERVALYSKAPWVGPRGAFDDPKWKDANRKNYSYLEYEGNIPPQREPPPDISPGMANEIMTASEEFKSITGIFDASLGNRSNEVSGVAIDSRKRGSETSNFHYIDNLSRSMRHAGRIMVDLIPKIYDTPRVVKILALDGEETEVQINAEGIDKKTQRPTNFILNAGRYDVAVDIGPSFTTQREESSQAQLELMKILPQSANLIADLMVKNFDWPQSDEIAKRLRMQLPANIEADENPQVKAMIEQSQQQLQQATQFIEILKQELQKKQQELDDKGEELRIKDKEADIKNKEVDRKAVEMNHKLVVQATEQELKYNENVPNSAV